MPFSLGQIFGGWKKKRDVKKTARHDMRSPRSSPTLGVKYPKTPSVSQERGRNQEFLDEKRAVTSSAQKGKSNLAWQTITAPHISEKGNFLGESGYIFKVANSANKATVRRAVEERYGVKVSSVRVINAPGKPRRRGQTSGEKPGFKKAVVSLKEGQSITDF